ncbi:hypothetical protein GI584_23445 [Gracilibacillus salitolerans]|uniref:TNase-like domain-containing protein n=1 Tax=Gracilibacillus salitolerans TaxID=2663022 RepID=A0A5Q2TPA0_9BACI|nr:thermonuclease family protein [Gracilibacillus salitolerans]QGH36824.1 hypothetical protein GI584_23445 [Gracilibacillus salitolerans]
MGNIAEEMEKEEKKLQEQEEKVEKELEEEENNKSIEDKNKELEAEYGELGTTEYDLEAITEEVTLKSVTDGETVVVEGDNGEETVQLLLIDTPEIVDPSVDPQEFGSRARSNLENLLGATLKLERGNPERNKNGHTLGYIWMKNGSEYVNFNKLLVQRGFAKVSNLSEPNTKYLDEFIEAENEAKQEQLKIWSIEGYVTDDGFDMSVYGR